MNKQPCKKLFSSSKFALSQLIIAVFLMVFGLFSSPCVAAEPKVTADAAVLVDAQTGQVYYAKNPHKHRSQASLTKIMTAMVAIEMGNPSDVVTISRRAQNIYVGQQINLQEGEKITLEQLVKAALIYSANDSTVAIAEHVGFSHDHFVQLMNQKAFLLGAFDTRFVNTNGYSVPNHYSSAYDIALITRYALKDPMFAQIVKTKEATITWVDSKRTKPIANTNSLLHDNYPGVDGVKTGTTIRAGKCLVASATRNDQQLVAVVLHSKNRFSEAARLFEYGFNEFTEQTAIKKGEVFGEAQVVDGRQHSVPLVSRDTLTVKAPSNGGDVSCKLHLPASIRAPVTKGQQLGYVTVLYNGKQLKQVPLVAQQEVMAQTWLYKLLHR